MEVLPLKLDGSYKVVMNPIRDERGYFSRAYDREIFAQYGLTTDWAQENQSQTARANTIRGLHFQLPPFSETKLVRAVQGAVLDVFVDLRRDSSTYGQWDSIELTEENLTYIYIPKGFAHGFRTLTDNATVQYKVDSVYSSSHDAGIRWNDSSLGIDWEIEEGKVVLSERDQLLPLFSEFDSPF